MYLATCMLAKIYNISLHFYKVYIASEAKVTVKVMKCQRELCKVLLQSNVLVALHSYVSLHPKAREIINNVVCINYIPHNRV